MSQSLRCAQGYVENLYTPGQGTGPAWGMGDTDKKLYIFHTGMKAAGRYSRTFAVWIPRTRWETT